MKKTLQFHDMNHIRSVRNAAPEDILQFLEDFRELQAQAHSKSTTKLISIKISEALLSAFRFKAEQEGVRYQTQIKKLMEEWLKNP